MNPPEELIGACMNNFNPQQNLEPDWSHMGAVMSIQLHYSLLLAQVFWLIWQGHWFMQTPEPCWSFHMNPLLNTSPHWTTKYFSVNKYWDINNICRAGQQAVQGSRSYSGASSPSADLFLSKGDWEITVHAEYQKVPLRRCLRNAPCCSPAWGKLPPDRATLCCIRVRCARACPVNLSQQEILVADT